MHDIRYIQYVYVIIVLEIGHLKLKISNPQSFFSFVISETQTAVIQLFKQG